MEKSPLEGEAKVAFGKPPANERVNFPVFLAAVGTAVFFYLSGSMTKGYEMLFVSNGTLIAYGLLLGRRPSIEIDFEKQVYFIRGRSQSEPKSSGGRLTDIRGISVTREIGWDSLSTVTYLEFYPEANQESYRIDNLPCSLSGKAMRGKMLLYLDLAARLNVPLRDDSGWNGEYPPVEEPKEIVVKPGETHPVFLRPPPAPKKWNKW